MKKNVERNNIKADLYDEIHVIADYIGLTDGDVDAKSSEIDALMDKGFTKKITPLTIDEIEGYGARQGVELSLAAKKTSIEEPKAIRYTETDGNVELVVYRNFCKVTLAYGTGRKHQLREYCALLNRIVGCLGTKKDFFKVQTISIQKKNQIFCASLYQLFGCFDKDMFGTCAQRKGNGELVLNAIHNTENFFSNEVEFDIVKSVERGVNSNNGKEVYRGQLNISGRYDTAPIDDKDIGNVLAKINGEMFGVFKEYLTEGFLQDMESGKTSKLIGGFKGYEQER